MEKLEPFNKNTSQYFRKARQLIEQTIQRNASPVPQLESIISAQATSNNQDLTSCHESRKLSLMDSVLEDYQHSVVVGDQFIKITGQNLELVQV